MIGTLVRSKKLGSFKKLAKMQGEDSSAARNLLQPHHFPETLALTSLQKLEGWAVEFIRLWRETTIEKYSYVNELSRGNLPGARMAGEINERQPASIIITNKIKCLSFPGYMPPAPRIMKDRKEIHRQIPSFLTPNKTMSYIKACASKVASRRR
jgi:hypothetical protein